MRYIVLCMAVLICIAPASAGLLDFLNGPTTGIDWDKTTITDAIRNIPADDISTRQERTSQGIAAKVKKDIPISVSVTQKNPLAVNLSPLGDYYIRIDKAEYEPSTGMLKTYIYATRNGRELDIKNPVRFYGMGYTYAPDPGAANINTGKLDEKGNPIWKAYEEENPRLALLSSIYSFLQTREYGRIENDGSDPTVVYYPGYDGSCHWSDTAGASYQYARDNLTSFYDTNIYARIQGHAIRPYNYTFFRRASFGFNLTNFYYNRTINAASLTVYIYNTSPINDLYYYSSSITYAYAGWAKSKFALGYDYQNYREDETLGTNASLSNVTGQYTRFFLTNPGATTFFTRENWYMILLRSAPDRNTPNRWSYGKTQGYQIYSVTYAGTSYDPFLTITYTVTDICPATTTCPTITTTPCPAVESEVIGEPGIISGIFLAVNEMTGGTITGIYNTLDYQPFLIIALIILGYAVLRRSGK